MCIITNVLRLRFKCIQPSVKRLLIACFVDLETDDILLKFWQHPWCELWPRVTGPILTVSVKETSKVTSNYHPFRPPVTQTITTISVLKKRSKKQEKQAYKIKKNKTKISKTQKTIRYFFFLVKKRNSGDMQMYLLRLIDRHVLFTSWGYLSEMN